MENITIRLETEQDHQVVENMTREAFWNLHTPGCDEHYLVHILRKHEDFIPELDFVAEIDGQIVGNMMYTKAKLIDEAGIEKEILTFGPLSVLPDYQRKGISKALLEVSFDRALVLGYDSIVIFGNPGNYVSRGFKSCKKYNICLENDLFPTAMLAKELKPDVFDGRKWLYCESPAYHVNSDEALEYDKLFAAKERQYQPSQEEFYIYSHSSLR